jgi:hypothetical protein
MLYRKPNYFRLSESQNTDLALFKLIKCTNFEIQDEICHHIVHILQH